jgi:hypothetical protein
MLQTPAQQTSSLQPAVSGWLSKQLPTQGQFQFDSGTQKDRAALAHEDDHATSQQSGSAAQTMLQQVESPQPGVGWLAPQSPDPGHVPKVTQTAFAVSTHDSFQPKVQQIGLTAHTASQHASFAQPGVP